MSYEDEYRCGRGPKVQETAAWLTEHAFHGEHVRDDPKEQPPAGSYHIGRIRCPCGASHVFKEDVR